ncbi:MAG TPA: toxic anion resistance protein [Gammaproteobacteria bacterium]|nr:toxic anion resistance protein [Gammaproteobacteria bacterium]
MAESATLEVADEKQLRSELHLTEPSAIRASADEDPKLIEQAEDVITHIMNIDMNDASAQEKTRASVETLGMQLQKEASRRSAMLKQPLTKMIKDSDEGGQVANSLVDLKLQVEEMDPARFDLEPGWFSRTLGFIPGIGTPLKRYFSRYENASTAMDAIIHSLEAGREQLKRDNTTLTGDQSAMRGLTLKLEQTIKLAQLIDQGLSEKLETELLQADPRHRFISEELLFPLRQRIQDLQQQLLVNQQGFLTVEMIIRNNKELMRGVNRALNTTVSALQVAVTLAMALANQKIVLEKVQAITETTDNLIAGTARRLRTQGAEIQKQASGSMLNIDSLVAAFSDIRAALEDISRYRQEALPRMADNILKMDKLADQSEQEIRKIEQAEHAATDFPIEIID